MTVRLYPGDNRETLRQLIDQGVRVHSVVTDPPYGLVSIEKRFKTGAAVKTEGNDGSFGRLSGGFMGKCFHPDTEILTASGWMKVDEIEVGDIVATLNPISRSTEWQAVAQTHAYPFDGDLVHVKHRSAEQMVTPNHKVLVSHDGGESLDLLTPRELKNSFHLFAQSAPQIGRNDDVIIRSVRAYGKDSAEYRTEKARFSPSAFFRFFGLWLGDGYCVVRSDDHPANDFFGINVKKKRKVDAVRSALRDLGIKFTESPATSGFTAFYCYDFALLGWLKLLGGAKEKRIPTFLFEWDAAHLEHLYQGLMDSDGCRQGKNQEVFQTSSRQLADDFQRLCFATGRSCAIALRPGGKDVVICGHKTVSSDAWVCCVLQQGKRMYGENSTRSSNVLHSVPYTGDVFCVGVPEHHIIYTRFNGKPVWSGNSWDGTGIERDPEFWKLIYDILLPGGYCFAFSGSRTGHWQACAMELAGFVMHPMHGWVFGCLDTDTKAATIDGVKSYTELKPGDEVICYDVNTGEYSSQPIIEVVEYDYEDTAFRIIGDFGEQVVSRNHRCIVEQDGREVFRFAEALEQQTNIPVLESLSDLQQALSVQRLEGVSKENLFNGMQKEGTLDQSRPNAYASFRSEGCDNNLCALQDEEMGSRRVVEKEKRSDVLQQILPCQDVFTNGSAASWSQGAVWMDRSFESVVSGEDGWIEKSGMEGRGYASQQEGQSRNATDKVCSLPDEIFVDVAKRRLRHGASFGSGECNGSTAIADRGCASHQPRRDGQSDNQLDVVQDQCGTQKVRAWSGHQTHVVRVMPFQYVGKVWCLCVPTGAFVAVRNGVAFPTGNSGFPKYHAADKAIDKKLGAPGSPEAAQWEGWAYGTQAQKPALEPIYLAQKPFSEKTGAENLMKHGVGAVNIDDCRVGEGGQWKWSKPRGKAMKFGDDESRMAAEDETGVPTANVQGRFPANLILDGSPNVVALFPESNGQQGDVRGTENSHTGDGNANCYGEYGRIASSKRNDTGSAARFFHNFDLSEADYRMAIEEGRITADKADCVVYNAKASKADREGSKHPCLLPGELVVTMNGFEAIENVKPGNMVLADDGTFQRVIDAFDSPADTKVYEFGVRSTNLKTVATDNHPFLVWNKRTKKSPMKDGALYWKNAEDVTTEDYFVFPVPNVEEKDMGKSVEWWKLFGYWLANGSKLKGSNGTEYPHFTVPKHRCAEYKTLIEGMFESVSSYDRGNVWAVIAFDKDTFVAYKDIAGYGAKNKRVGLKVLEQRKEAREAFLQGYLDGDGCIVKGSYRAVTVSPGIAGTIPVLAASLGIQCSVYNYDNSDKTVFIEGREIQAANEYRMYFSKARTVTQDGVEYIYRKVKTITETPYQGPVWNITVENRHTFMTATGMSHNTVKPIALMQYLVRHITPPGGTVLDPFAGSGSTGVAASREGFDCILMEAEPEYIEFLQNRFAEDKDIERFFA